MSFFFFFNDTATTEIYTLSLHDALPILGLGFTMALLILGTIRELLGNGSFFGVPVTGASFEPMLIMILPPGAFLTIGFVMAFLKWLENRKAAHV